MAQIRFTSGFYTDAEAITSKKVLMNLNETIKVIATFPLSGSTTLPSSLELRYGSSARKAVVAPFDLIYEYNEATDEVHLLGLIHFRQAK